MARAGRRATWRLRRMAQLVVGLTLVASALTLVAAPASAMTCQYDTAARVLSVTLAPTDGVVTIRANGPYLEVGDVFCALLAETNSVTINASPDSSAQLGFDLGNGPLGPGNLNEGNGSSEIEFTITGLNSTSTLYLNGTEAADKVTIGWLQNKVTGYSAGQINLNAFADGATVDNDISFPSLPGLIEVFSYGGDDIVSGAGTGTVYTGQTYVPLRLVGGLGANQLTGGGGNDLISFDENLQPEGGDILVGGGGYDRVRAFTDNSIFTRASISLDGIANDGSGCPGTLCNGDNVGMDFESVEGSQADEIITGNDSAQHLSGNGGNDLVQGFGGDDTFTCGPGSYEGGPGRDTFEKSGARAAYECGIVRGGGGFDTVDYRYSQDPVSVTLDNLSNDGRVGATGNIRTDIEQIIGSAHNDSLTGSDGAETLNGMAGDDTLAGLGGADVLMPGPGTDAVAGGPGTDKLSYANALVPVVIDAVAKAVTGEGNDTFSSIETYVGSTFADVMDGSGANERLIGNVGNDDLFGAGGNDVLLGGEGDDTLNGGTGTDKCTQAAGTGSVSNCEG